MPDYTILLIDYEPRSIQLVRETLEGGGYRLAVAGDGIAGVEAFNELQPDLTLVEAMLPKKHGFEVCQQLKTTSHGAVTPVAIITAVYKGRKYRNQALHHYKADEYLEKPIAPDLLLSTVKRLLEASPAARPAVAVEPPNVQAVRPEPVAAPAPAVTPAATVPVVTAVSPASTPTVTPTVIPTPLTETSPPPATQAKDKTKPESEEEEFDSAAAEIAARVDALFS
jgi:DNA-binding response OmpR family regulator